MFQGNIPASLWLSFFALTLTSTTGLGQATSARPRIELDCKHLSPIEQSYLVRHVNFSNANRNLEVRTIEQFIKKLDGSKIYLLEADVKEIEKMMEGIFQKTKARACEPIKKAQEILVKRVTERVDFVREELGKKFKFNDKTELVLDPEARKYPKTLKEAEAFHRKYLQFQVANYLATDMKIDEAKQNVIRSYERILRRVKETKDTDLLSNYLDAFSHSLDPHSSYLSADALEDFEIQMRLSLEGIGATLSSRDGFTVIEQLIPGGAAAESGKLKTKDKIIAVAQGEESAFTNVIEMDLRDVVRLIRGPKGTKVKLSILRKEGKETQRFSVTLVRDRIKLEDEAASITYIDREIKPGVKRKIGLVNLPSFYADNRKQGRSAAKDLKKILTEAAQNAVDGIVLDLSTNGGGSLEDAVKIAGLFFRTGNVVKQSHRDPNRGELELADDDPAVDYNGPLVVLISRISASASEIVAGTLQDYKRAVIVGGDHTFGKGTVQSVEPLPPGLGALKTTVGMFFTPGGESTQHRGVSSDIIFPSPYSTDDIGEKTLDHSLPPKRIKAFLSKEAFVTEGMGSWKQIDPATILKLRTASQKRIATSKDFDKVKENLTKAQKRGKIIKVSEVLKDKESKDGDSKKVAEGSAEEDPAQEDLTLSREEKKKKYLERADVQEAVNIAVDLVGEIGKPGVTIGAKEIEGNKDSVEN